MAWIALLATVFVYAAEVNPVPAQHLWPRSIFTAGLTEQDRVVLNAEVESRAAGTPSVHSPSATRTRAEPAGR